MWFVNVSGHGLLAKWTYYNFFVQVQLRRFCPKNVKSISVLGEFWELQNCFKTFFPHPVGLKNSCTSSRSLSLAASICSPGFSSVIFRPTPFCSLCELSLAFVVQILLSIPSVPIQPTQCQYTQTHSHWNTLSLVPARRKPQREEKGEEGLKQLWFWSRSPRAPLAAPFSISSLAPPGTQALARPQEAGSQDQAEREKKGEQWREGRILQKKGRKESRANSQAL